MNEWMNYFPLTVYLHLLQYISRTAYLNFLQNVSTTVYFTFLQYVSTTAYFTFLQYVSTTVYLTFLQYVSTTVYFAFLQYVTTTVYFAFLQYVSTTVYFTFLQDVSTTVYYIEKSVLLGTKPFVDSIRHFIRDPSGVFSVCHLCECRFVQWRHNSRLLLLLNWFLHIIKRTLHVGSKIWILCSRGKNNISRVSEAHSRYCSCHSNIKFISSRHRVISSIYSPHQTVNITFSRPGY